MPPGLSGRPFISARRVIVSTGGSGYICDMQCGQYPIFEIGPADINVIDELFTASIFQVASYGRYDLGNDIRFSRLISKWQLIAFVLNE